MNYWAVALIWLKRLQKRPPVDLHIPPSKYNALSWALWEKISPTVPRLIPAEVRRALWENSIKLTKNQQTTDKIDQHQHGEIWGCQFSPENKNLRE